jgi:hypothetical protein
MNTNTKNLNLAMARTLLFGMGLFLSCNAFAAPPFATKAELAAEAAARIAADGTLQTNINSEASARTAADTALQSQIDDLAPSGLAIGDAYGGGVVFYVNATGTHGLVAATQDQSASVTWFEAQNAISNAANHDAAGQAFADWRLPTKHELNLLHAQQGVVGGFANGAYWSSTEADAANAWVQIFDFGSDEDGVQTAHSKSFFSQVRAVRAF